MSSLRISGKSLEHGVIRTVLREKRMGTLHPARVTGLAMKTLSWCDSGGSMLGVCECEC